MNVVLSSKPVFPRVSRVACLKFVAPLPMPLQMAYLRERPSADLAPVGPLSGVYPLVLLEVGAVPKRTPARATLERPLPRVDPLVNMKAALVRKGLLADGTAERLPLHVRSCVCGDVLCGDAGEREGAGLAIGLLLVQRVFRHVRPVPLVRPVLWYVGSVFL